MFFDLYAIMHDSNIKWLHTKNTNNPVRKIWIIYNKRTPGGDPLFPILFGSDLLYWDVDVDTSSSVGSFMLNNVSWLPMMVIARAYRSQFADNIYIRMEFAMVLHEFKLLD